MTATQEAINKVKSGSRMGTFVQCARGLHPLLLASTARLTRTADSRPWCIPALRTHPQEFVVKERWGWKKQLLAAGLLIGTTGLEMIRPSCYL